MARSDPAKPKQPRQQPPGRRRVLFIPKDEAVRQLVISAVTRDGYQVDVADTAGNALRLLDENLYALIVSELGNPELDGPTLFRELKRREANDWVPVIFLADQLFTPDYAGFIMQAGAPVLVKPLTAERIRDAVSRMLAGP
jgi:DNA-binding response OmpR family regulator